MSLYRTWLWRKTSFGDVIQEHRPCKKIQESRNEKAREESLYSPTALKFPLGSVSEAEVSRDGIYCQSIPYPTPTAIDHTPPFCWMGMNQRKTVGSHCHLIWLACYLKTNCCPLNTQKLSRKRIWETILM